MLNMNHKLENIKEKMRTVVEQNDTLRGRVFDYCIQCLIVISIIAFSIDTVRGISETIRFIIGIVDKICVIAFSLEYITRVFIAKKRLKYIFSFYGIIDLLAILPFYLNLFIDLRILRIFRILRLFAAFKLIRYSRAMHRFSIAYSLVKEEFILFFMVSCMLIFISASGIYFFEHEAQPEVFGSVFQSLWWSAITLTTVGYGDTYPITIAGKVFTFFVLMFGVGMITVPAGILASALSRAHIIEKEQYKSKSADEKDI